MADLADRSTADEAEYLAAALTSTRVPIAPGEAGECDGCEWWMPRLIDGLCAFCRDRRRRPDDWEAPTPPADFIPKPKEMPAMLAKTIQLPAYATEAIAAVDRVCAAENCTIGEAARLLIMRGIGVEDPVDVPSGIIDLGAISLPALFEELERRIAKADTAASDLVERAELAERKLATIREAVA